MSDLNPPGEQRSAITASLGGLPRTITRSDVHEVSARADVFDVSGPQSRNGVIPAFRLLAAGVPLSLLVDLADPDGPDSAAILRTEKAAHLDSHACRDRDGTPSSARAATG